MGFATRLWRSRRLRGWAGFEQTIWSRKVADQEVRKLIAPLNPASLSVLEISGEVWREYGFQKHTSTHYPPFDICADRLDETFDLVIAEHIFEHLLRPYQAARHVFMMVKPGGRFLMVAPFLYRVHRDPQDCSRWTETGMKYFLAEAGFPLDGIQTGSWGNRAVVGRHFRREFTLFNRHLHSLRNEPDFPLVVWALARRAS